MQSGDGPDKPGKVLRVTVPFDVAAASKDGRDMPAAKPRRRSERLRRKAANLWASAARRLRLETPQGQLRRALYKQFGAASADHTVQLVRRFGLRAASGRNPLPAPGERECGQWLALLRRAAAAACSGDRPRPDCPDVSIIIPVYNQLRYTLACLLSLLTWPSRYSFEIIVADDCSTDDTPRVMSELTFVRHLRGETNRGFIRNCNTAACAVRGRYVLLLNNDTLILPGWLDELIDTLEADPSVGLAGSKLLFANGTLQEAGGLIWGNRHIWNYGRGGDPMRPEFSYAREVDYISGASIALPTSLWHKLGGFDEWYEVAYAEDTDLAQRVKQAGRRVVFQPLSMLVHFEGVTSGTDLRQGAKAYQVANVEKLFQRWGDVFAHYRPDGQCVEQERERAVTRRALVVDYITPTPDKDAGSMVTWAMIRAFQAIGYKVTFVAGITFHHCGHDTQRLQRVGVEVPYRPYDRTPNDYIRAHGHLYDVVLLIRYEVAMRLLDDVRSACARAKVLFLPADLHFLRETRRLAIEGSTAEAAAKLQRDKAAELDIIRRVDRTIVHSTHEQAVLSEETPQAAVDVYPLIVDPVGRGASYTARRDIMFLGGYRHNPNIDAVLYFAAEVWPAVRAAVPDMRFFVLGSDPTPDIRALDGRDGIVVTGFVEDLDPWFDRIRLSVAPLRFGAGTKGKVALSLAHGLPCVLTRCAAEGMELAEGTEVVVADDPAAMADAILHVYRDEAAWRALSDAGLAYVDRVLSFRRACDRLADVLERMDVRPRAETD
jgi:Predicted glycosyltransferases